jgi:hypothetical protein
MKKTLLACALLASAAMPAQAITFRTLTPIYVGTGAVDDGGGFNLGIATSINCSNVSGVSAQVRITVRRFSGPVEGSVTFTLLHGGTRTASTHSEATFDLDFNLATGPVFQGLIQVYSTQSGVFCNAIVTDAADAGNGFNLGMVRLNPHPGTME